MRTMFAVGHQTGTHTTIVIAGRPQVDRRAVTAKPQPSVTPRAARPEASAKAPAQGVVH